MINNRMQMQRNAMQAQAKEEKKERKKQLSITLTFKETEKDLYDEVMKHSSKGGWIKDLIRSEIDRQ